MFFNFKHFKINKFLTAILVFLFSAGNTYSQSAKANNSVYYEFGGVGLGEISFNYERFFHLSEKLIFATGAGVALSTHSGTSETTQVTRYQLFIPVQASFLIGRKKHKLELGYGQPIAMNKGTFGVSSSFYVAKIGYRFQNKTRGLLLKASLNPVYAFGLRLHYGIGFGYSF